MTGAHPVVLVDTPGVRVVHDPESESFDVTLSGCPTFTERAVGLRNVADCIARFPGLTIVVAGGTIPVVVPPVDVPEVVSALRLAVGKVAPFPTAPVEVRPNPAPPRRSGRTGAPDAKPVTLSRTCTVCNGVMTLKRSHAATCSPRCRQRLSRERRGLAPKPVGVVVFRRRRGGAR